MRIARLFALSILALASGALAQDQAFVHRASPANTATNSTYIDHPLTSSRPSSLLLITHNYTPAGTATAMNNHNTGVWYDGGRRQWAIFNQDMAAMPVGAAFNVVVLDGSSAAVGAWSRCWKHRRQLDLLQSSADGREPGCDPADHAQLQPFGSRRCL